MGTRLDGRKAELQQRWYESQHKLRQSIAESLDKKLREAKPSSEEAVTPSPFSVDENERLSDEYRQALKDAGWDKPDDEPVQEPGRPEAGSLLDE